MAEKDFKLPSSSTIEIKKLMIAYAKSKSPCSLDNISKLTGINRTSISSNNGFLESIGAIKGGNAKEATEIGKKLGLAYANNMEVEIEEHLRELLLSNTFIESMITALEIKPRTNDDFQSHIAYSLSKDLKSSKAVGTGTRTIIELLKVAKVVEEKEGVLYPINHTAKDSFNDLINKTDIQTSNSREGEKGKEDGKSSFTKQITNKLDNNVILNINIQLTIPETENEKVYESFFEAMKKHLLS